MRSIPRLLLAALLAGALAGGLGSCGGGDDDGTSGSAGGKRTPASTTVTMREYEFSPKAVDVRSGETLTVVNDGEIAHNLTIGRGGGGQSASDVLATTGTFLPGKRVRLPISLATGRTYVMVCTVPGHRDLGMAGKLRVR